MEPDSKEVEVRQAEVVLPKEEEKSKVQINIMGQPPLEIDPKETVGCDSFRNSTLLVVGLGKFKG